MPIDKQEFNRIIGKDIEDIRKASGLTLEQLSGDTDGAISKNTLSNIENGNQQISLYQIYLIEEALRKKDGMEGHVLGEHFNVSFFFVDGIASDEEKLRTVEEYFKKI